MKIIINETQRGFLFKDGVYKKLLIPGKHHISAIFGYSYALVDIRDSIEIWNTDIEVLLKDANFANSVDRIDVPDGFVALHMQDGRVVNTLSSGTYCFWNCYRKNTFTLFDTTNPEITELISVQLASIPDYMYRSIEVEKGKVGILMFDGKVERLLKSGRYYFWNSKVNVTCQVVDLRLQQLDVSGQEILTADKVSLRLNFVCTYKITDALKIVSEIKDYKEQIYTMTQLALREYVGKFRFDELLEQKENIASYVLEQLKFKQSDLFVEFTAAGLKDIILPGEIRDIMNTVLVAEKNAQANVIARREEVASTRSLLNTAKLMDENTTLYKLKELECLEKICDKVGNISVGNGNLLGELRGILSR